MLSPFLPATLVVAHRLPASVRTCSDQGGDGGADDEEPRVHQERKNKEAEQLARGKDNR